MEDDLMDKFIKYPVPKKGVFSVCKKDAQYILPDGWENELKEYTIIGEDDTEYVYMLQPFEYGLWVGNKVVNYKTILPMGVHKSRLVKWTSGQLSLFETNDLISI
jgi:hypothetical protein